MICQRDRLDNNKFERRTCGNAHPSDKVVDDGPDGRLPDEIGRECAINGDDGSEGYDGRAEPVDSLPPVMAGDRR